MLSSRPQDEGSDGAEGNIAGPARHLSSHHRLSSQPGSGPPLLDQRLFPGGDEIEGKLRPGGDETEGQLFPGGEEIAGKLFPEG